MKQPANDPVSSESRLGHMMGSNHNLGFRETLALNSERTNRFAEAGTQEITSSTE